jgi:hypothetical protein
MSATAIKTAPAARIGMAGPGATRFHPDDAIGATDGCIPTAFRLKPFGLNQIVVQWQDPCRGTAPLLSRGGR